MAVNLLPQAASLEEWKDYLRTFGAAAFVWAEDTPDQRAARAYNIQYLGTTVVVDREGRVAYRDESTSTYEMLRPPVMEALRR